MYVRLSSLPKKLKLNTRHDTNGNNTFFFNEKSKGTLQSSAYLWTRLETILYRLTRVQTAKNVISKSFDVKKNWMVQITKKNSSKKYKGHPSSIHVVDINFIS